MDRSIKRKKTKKQIIKNSKQEEVISPRDLAHNEPHPDTLVPHSVDNQFLKSSQCPASFKSGAYLFSRIVLIKNNCYLTVLQEN